MNEPPNPEVAIFAAALELPADQRGAYLEQACAGNAALRRQVEALLRDHDDADNFFNKLACVEQPTPVEEATPGANRTIRIGGLASAKAGDRIGRYKLLQQIGEGGCGVVYMAEQEEPVRRRVALKVIKLGMDTKSVIARFEAERQALALMDHPNIAKVFDAGATDTGRPYFVMELVRGIKITDYCDQTNLAIRERLDLFVQVCRAIQHAHQKGIIHRDIKPSNILVTVNDAVAVPKVIDFGIAKATQGRLTDQTLFTAFEQFIGTPAYMSPEQAVMTSVDIDTRTDVYSLGVLLYELLTGQTPFDQQELLKAGLDEMRRTIKEREPQRPSARLSTMAAEVLTPMAKQRHTEAPKLIHLVQGDLDWIVMKSLEKDRNRRYETANGFARDIERYLADEPVTARPPSRLYEFQKAVRRHRLGFGVTVLLMAVLGIGIVVSTHEAIRARRAEQEQSRLRELAEQSQRVEAQQRRAAEADRAEAVRQRGIASAQEMLARRRFYDAEMNLANQAWNSGELARTADLLETQQPRPGQPDLRSFEWYYLWGLCNGRLLHTIHAHSSLVEGVAFSPDGTSVVSGGIDGTIRLWDTATGLRRFLLIPDGDATVNAVAFTPDGKTLISGGNFVRFWDVDSGKLRGMLPKQSDWVRSLAVSPDGNMLAFGGDNGMLRLWNLAKERESANFDGHQGPVLSVAFSIDNINLASSSDWGDDGGVINLWTITNGLAQLKSKIANATLAVAFSPDGKTLAAASWDEIKLWDATTCRLGTILKGHVGRIGGLSFLPDGRSLVSCGSDRTVRLWQWPADDTSNAVGRVIGAHLDSVLCLAVTRDGKMLATGADDGSVKLWNIADHDARQDSRATTEFKFGDEDWWHGLSSVLPLPDEKRILVVTQIGAELRDIVSGRKLASWPDAIGHAALSADGKLLATGQTDGTLKLWEVATQKLIASCKTKFGAPVLAFSPDGRTLAAGGAADVKARSSLIRMWDVAAGLKSIQTIDTGYASIDALSFSPNGKTLAAAPGDILLFNASTGQGIGTIKMADQMNIGAIVFSPDSRILATGREGGVVCLWNPQTGELLKELKGHTSTVLALAFSPDGGTLASGGEDATVRLWDVQTGQECMTLTRPNTQYKVTALAFADASTLIAGYEDGLVSIRRGIHNPEADVESIVVEKSADSRASFLQSRADGLARGAQWQAAIAAITNLMESDPAGNNSYQLATLLVVSKDLAAYRQLCPAILAKFKGTTDPFIANRVAKACLILPSSGADLKEVAILADTSVLQGTNAAELPWFQLTKGLAEYRLGHFANTLEWAQKVSIGGNPGRDAEACAVLAMTHYQLQQFDEARSALVKGEDITETKLPKLESGDLGEDCRNWIIAHALLDEAKQLINGGSKTKKP